MHLFHGMLVFSVISMVSSSDINDTSDVHVEHVLNILVLLPHREGPNKLPFGAEMSGAAGK